MLDKLHDTIGGVDKHRGSSNQYRASAGDSKVFHKNLKGEVLFFMQQEGKSRSKGTPLQERANYIFDKLRQYLLCL